MWWNPLVNVHAFLESLASRWDDFPNSETPRDQRFTELIEAVPGLTRPNNLALLNHAASQLPSGEMYVEVGSLRGTSLIAAMLDNDEKTFVAIDDFSRPEATRAELERNLKRFGCEQAKILEGDAFEILRVGDPLLKGQPAGVYYYDAAHTYEQQYEGLKLAESYLADRALLIVDDSDWDFVAQATEDYLRDQRQAELVLELPGKEAGRPDWWLGVQVLSWKRTA